MRFVIIAIILLPCWSSAQINRSANELANEKVIAYLSEKIFKGQGYQTAGHGPLKSYKGPDEKVTWFIIYKVASKPALNSVSNVLQEPFYFIFYLDKKLNVLLAESFNDTEDHSTGKDLTLSGIN